MSYPTSRSFPRTLQDAFQQDNYAWFEGPEKQPCAWCIPAWLFALSVASYLIFK